MSDAGEANWPGAAFSAPLLRGLDDRGRRDVARAGRLLRLNDGDEIYAAGVAGDSIFVVVDGEIELTAVRRGDEGESVLRRARRGDSFGEEAALPGAERCATARARGAARLAEVPVAVLTRVLGRDAASPEVAERESRALRRSAARDLLSASALGRDLPEDDFDLLLDAARWWPVSRGERVFSAGDAPGGAYVVVDGLIQLQLERDGRVQVVGYLSRGDFFGDEDALLGDPRRMTAVALGDAQLLELPRAALRTLADRNPGLLGRMRRLERERETLQRDVVGLAAAQATQHVFHDLYRMQMARSLLVIDQDSCVRCGHCAWACAEVHEGVARLVRRGDKIVTQLAMLDDRAPATLLVPNSCQHCKNPACMIDCPTGAIGRDPEGEVFIREELCTGCEACAKACPWDNIRMAPRAGEGSANVAVKCDLCREFDQPACVAACPTESILRLDPQRDFDDVRRLFGHGEATRSPTLAARRRFAAPVLSGVGLAAGGVMLAQVQSGAWSPGRGPGLICGWVAAGLVLGLAAYVVPKRGIRYWLARRERESAPRRAVSADAPTLPRSKLRPHAIAHAVMGLAVVVLVLGHAGLALGATPAGALALSFWATVALGGLGALLGRVAPRALARLERRGTLPEDFRAERQRLEDRLYRATSGQNELFKKLVERVLLPYARAPFGAARLLASGRDVGQEARRLRGEIEGLLDGRGGERLRGLDDAIRVVVDLRALAARRVLTALLRGYLPLHAITAAIVVVLLLVHVIAMVRW